MSLYVSPTTLPHEVLAHLREEQSHAENIKDKHTRKAVVAALKSLQVWARDMSPSETGWAVFATPEDLRVVQPKQPVPYLYRCGSTLFLDPLERQEGSRDTIGLIVIDQKECSIGVLEGAYVRLLHSEESFVMNKHGQGGSSQARFGRLHEEQVHNWYKNCAEAACGLLRDAKVVLVGGPGMSKNEFVKLQQLYHIRDKIADTFDVGYTNEQGLKELAAYAEAYATESAAAKAAATFREFLRRLAKDLPCEYGPAVAGIEPHRIEAIVTNDDLPADTELGRQLKSLGGVAALLRY